MQEKGEYMINFKQLPDSEKPRERLVNNGKESLSNEELLSIILKTGIKNMSVKEVSYELLNLVKDIRNLRNISINNLINIKGIGKVKAIELLAVIELGKRIYTEVNENDLISCTSPDNIINYFNYLFKDKKQEEFYVIFLDNKKKYISKKLLFIGSINFSVVHPREIFKEAYLCSASFIICLHNHPSGDSFPSKEDDNITKKIKEIGLIHGIPLIDHIIIGKKNYYSYFENEKIK